MIGTSPLPFRSVVVTGGDGFVGRSLVTALVPRLAPDATLRFLGRRAGSGQDRIKRLTVDLRDAAQAHAAIRAAAPDLILHLAAQSSVAQGNSTGGPAETWSVNMTGSLNIAQACVTQGFVGTFLFVSSAEVYGRSFLLGAVEEQTALSPQSAYARSKAAAEAMLADVLPAESRLIVARPGNHSGPGQDERFVLPSFATQIAAIEAGGGDPTLQVGNLDAERDFLDVRDVVDAYLAILALPVEQGKRMTFNIASGHTIQISALLDHLRSLSHREIRIEQDPARLRPSDIAKAAIDVGALRAATDWMPSRSVNTMLSEILEYQRTRYHRSEVSDN